MTRKALITGGTAGLGEAIARSFANRGIVCAVNYNSNHARAETLVENLVPGSCSIKADVSSRTECQQLVKQAIEKLGGLDIVVSNAGWTKPALFPDIGALSESDWDKCWAYNVKAHIWLLQAVQSTFEGNISGGHFVITASFAGTRAGGSSIAYCVSKAGTIALTSCLAKAVAPKIQVNAVSPSMLNTEWSDKAYSPEQKRAHIQNTALKKLPDINDVAGIYEMIVNNSSMTGENITISCGIGLV